MRKIFITGIGTDVGKTVVAAVLTEALQADYWKPIQAGVEPITDSQVVKSLISNAKSIVHPEAVALKNAMSPHAAAVIENIEITFDKIKLPNTNNTLIIEGAGGLMVPINQSQLVVDLIPHFNAEVILVMKNYLGSINHTLLSIELLKQKQIKILGIIISGESNSVSEEFILNYCKLNLLGRVGWEKNLDKEIILKYSKNFLAV